MNICIQKHPWFLSGSPSEIEEPMGSSGHTGTRCLLRSTRDNRAAETQMCHSKCMQHMTCPWSGIEGSLQPYTIVSQSLHRVIVCYPFLALVSNALQSLQLHTVEHPV